MRLDRVRHVAEAVSRARLVDPEIERFPRHAKEASRLGADPSDREGLGSIRIESISFDPDVHPNDVPFLKNSAPRDAVDHLVVHGEAGRGGVASVPFEGGQRSLPGELPRRDAVELLGRDPGLERVLQDLESSKHDGVRLVHLLELAIVPPTDHGDASWFRRAAAFTRSVSRRKISGTAPLPSMRRTRAP